VKQIYSLSVQRFNLVITFCIHNVAGNTVGQHAETVQLRSKAQAPGFSVGAAVRFEALMNDKRYGEILANEYNVITAESEMKLERYVREGRGHTLIWHYSMPRWLIEGNFSKDEVAAILKQHIPTVISRYRG
jgi:endo-1,4-beta-xylanase